MGKRADWENRRVIWCLWSQQLKLWSRECCHTTRLGTPWQTVWEEPINSYKHSPFHSDSMSALQNMESGDLDEETSKILDVAEKFKTTHLVRLVLQWIPGHTDIWEWKGRQPCEKRNTSTSTHKTNHTANNQTTNQTIIQEGVDGKLGQWDDWKKDVQPYEQSKP